MSGWNKSKVEAFKLAFYEFLNHITIMSKEKGKMILGKNIYRAQQVFLDGVFEGLERDIHSFFILKSRQLGISTISRPLSIFWLGMHPGLRAYLVYDTTAHAEEARLELINVIENLPARLKFPRIVRQNRYLMELSNGSMMTFASAGVRTGKSSGVLGRSSGINFVHASEMCSWQNTEGLEAFRNALAEDFENRLYIWESTARGFNQWYDMWQEAKSDPDHNKCIFIGWHQKDNQQIASNHPDFLRYGVQPPTDLEIEMIHSVEEQYGWKITPEQLAWYRRKMNPGAEQEGDADIDYSGDVYRIQEQPSTEQEAFQQTGATFFESEKLTRQSKEFVSNRFKAYAYIHGHEFHDTRVIKAANQKSIELKVWEEPEPAAVYVLAADPAFGHNEKNDRSAIQVLRCYADGIDQVAEYAWPMCTTDQFAWNIASLLGWYSSYGGEVYLIVELNGPGDAVWRELQNLKFRINLKYKEDEYEDEGLAKVFQNVRNFLYSRSDAMGPGRSYHWKTTGPLKVSIMERLRSYVANTLLHIRSQAVIEEMAAVTRDGDSIEATGTNKDDRVMALAMAIHFWDERIRRIMISSKRTRDAEAAKRHRTIKDQVNMFSENMLTDFFNRKQAAQRTARLAAQKQRWRGR